MLVNKTPAAKTEVSDLNFEAVDPFNEDDDEFGEVQTPQYDKVQAMLSNTNPRLNDARVAKAQLGKLLGNEHRIFARWLLVSKKTPTILERSSLVVYTSCTKCVVYTKPL